MAKAVQARKKRMPEVVPVVGIGASAGGLEAFRNFLNALPANTGMAFVLIPHLMHTQENLFGRLISNATPMPVTQVASHTVVRPNHVYVIGPNKDLSIEGGHIESKALIPGVRRTM